MTRRDAIRAVTWTGAAAAGNARPAKPPDGFVYREYFRCLPDTLRDWASEALGKRNEQLSNVNTIAEIRARQNWARETFWSLIGGRREKTPLRVRTTGRMERRRHFVEKLLYEGRTGEWISANLYLPKSGSAKYPGILFQAGHSKDGKAADTYQRCCQALAQLGFAVLTFDPFGQGERTNYPGADGLTRFAVADDEHTVPGRQLLLAGETMTRLLLEDAIKSLDVLASVPQVDAHGIGAAGQSGGGTLTMMLAAVDDRISAAVVSCGNTENVACEKFHPPGSVDDAEQNFLGSGRLGFDRWDLLWPFAPRPLLVLASAKDFFDTYSPNYAENGRKEFDRLAAAYRAFGKSNQIRRYASPLPHGLSYELRLELYRWLVRWLQDDRREIAEEPPVQPEPDSELWATRSGSVTRDEGSRTAFRLVRVRASQINTPTERPDLRKILGISELASSVRLEVLSSAPSRNCKILATEVQTARDAWIPMWVFVPENRARQIVVVLDPAGRNEGWQEGQLYQNIARRAIVCVPDVRGTGDLRPEFSSGAPEYARSHQSEESYAWGSLVLRQPLLGQRVEDLLGAMAAIRTRFSGLPLSLLAARGPMTIPGLCAAFLDSDVGNVYISGHLVSWRSVMEAEEYSCPFGNFVPNILAKTDLPYIANAIAPRRVMIAGAVDATGKTTNTAAVRAVYTGANIEVRNAEPWDQGTLLSLL